jgi:hypothetical protein
VQPNPWAIARARKRTMAREFEPVAHDSELSIGHESDADADADADADTSSSVRSTPTMQSQTPDMQSQSARPVRQKKRMSGALPPAQLRKVSLAADPSVPRPLTRDLSAKQRLLSVGSALPAADVQGGSRRSSAASGSTRRTSTFIRAAGDAGAAAAVLAAPSAPSPRDALESPRRATPRTSVSSLRPLLEPTLEEGDETERPSAARAPSRRQPGRSSVSLADSASSIAEDAPASR